MSEKPEYPIKLSNLLEVDTRQRAMELSEKGYLLLQTLKRTYEEPGHPPTEYAVYVMAKPE